MNLRINSFLIVVLLVWVRITNTSECFTFKSDANETHNSPRIHLNKFDCEQCFTNFEEVVQKKWNKFPNILLPQYNASETCLKETAKVLSAAENMEIWALKMLDSTAKLPSGILNGNVNQYGDFDQCLSITELIRGQYCLANFRIPIEKYRKDIDSLVYSHHWARSNLTDIAHRVPKISIIHWGVCLPASCTSDDLQIAMKSALKHYEADVYINPNLCITKDVEKSYSAGKIFTLFIFGLILICIIYGTVNNTSTNQKNILFKVLNAFSLKENFKQLINLKSVSKAPGLDGIRGLNAFGLLLSHKTVSLFFNPYVNRTNMANIFTLPWSVIGRTAILYTDSFLLLSGFLNATSFIEDINKSGKINFKYRFINRLFRILPNLLGLILFCTFILPDLGSGPQWGVIIEEHSRLCKANMWKNLLFVHNYMGFENMCLTHTHHLGIDMQLFLVTPIAIFIIWKLKDKGAFILCLIALASTKLRFSVALNKQLSMVVYSGMPVFRYFDSANFSYILPTHRATIYLMGIGLACFKRSNVYLTKFQATVGWVLGVGFGLLVGIGPMHMAVLDYEYNALEAAYYSAFAPILWGCFILWAIWACENNCAGWFGRFLDWRGFTFFTKISYAVYLTQFPIFFYNVGIQRHSDYYSIFKLINIPEFTIVILTSIVLVLFIEMPFNNIHKIIFDKELQHHKRNKLKINDCNNNIKAINKY